MDDYPDARVFYKERAWLRRIEFRRRMKKHQRKLGQKNQVFDLMRKGTNSELHSKLKAQ